MAKYLLEVRNLKKHFVLEKNLIGNPVTILKAVEGVSFQVKEGKTLGIVGESGCGKTTLGRTILRLHDITEGEVLFNGVDLASLSKRQLRKLRTKIQIIFQDPYSSLSPRFTVGEIIKEAVAVHKIVPKENLREHVSMIMRKCGLKPEHYDRYPHEFSGGQRQRICIARALAVNPQLVVCDEPVSALDVSVQAQILNLLKQLQEDLKLTYLFISHDLSVIKYISDDIAVMYLGSIVEQGSKDTIFANPMHPYTKALFSAVPIPDPTSKKTRIILEGDIPSPANPPSGCKFHTRCRFVMDKCRTDIPQLVSKEEDHLVACHLYEEEV